MRFCFLILHYNNIELTTKAVNSIRSLDKAVGQGDLELENETDIVIVDNGSPNNSGIVIKQLYENTPGIHVILTGENGGFAKGNNAGFKYIKEKLCSPPKGAVDFVIDLNNDITFPQKDFLKRLTEVYEKSEPKFHVAGPDVYTPHIRSHISPLYKCVRGRNEAKAAIEVLEKINEQFRHGVSFKNYTRYLQEKYQGTWLLKAYNRLRKHEYDGACAHNEVLYNCVLNGACLIFDKRFIEENDILFEEKTFLYVEEDFLTKRMLNAGKVTRYSPELIVDHVGQGSSGFSKMNYKSYVAKNIATNERCIEAWKIYENTCGS